MRISDWSSDVCSSDLRDRLPAGLPVHARTRARADHPAVGRRTQPAAAGQAVRAAVQPAGDGRTDQRPRCRDAGVAGRTARRLPGTLLLVSHDRDFLDNVVTSTLVMEGNGRVGEYVGGYSDWLRQRRVEFTAPASAKSASMPVSPVAAAAATPSAPKRKLSYKDARELEQLPLRIEELEAKVASMTDEMNHPAFYQRGADGIAAHNTAMADVQAELDRAYARWSELE